MSFTLAYFNSCFDKPCFTDAISIMAHNTFPQYNSYILGILKIYNLLFIYIWSVYKTKFPDFPMTKFSEELFSIYLKFIIMIYNLPKMYPQSVFNKAVFS